MAEDDSQKTEQPSGRKLAKARSQGQVVQSREINSLFMLGTGAGLILFAAPSLAARLNHTLARFLDPATLLDANGIRWHAIELLLRQIGAGFIVPVLLLVVMAIAGSVMQTGFVLATDKIGFDASRLSPISGFERLFSFRGLSEFLKGVIKAAIAAAIAAWLALPEVAHLPLFTSLDAMALMGELRSLILRLTGGVLAFLAVLALLDYGYQRFIFLRSLRMSKQEVKEEHKQSEGDPIVKARLRQIRMERARKRMMAAVPTASVVITNPTHFAVALKYEMGDKGAPRVVAKGADLVAHRIREVARENGVPLVENPPLARALYATVDIDREIPEEHYRAVAEIISYVFRLKGKPRAR
jgi:flagellar biosynthesis protein FlhB